MAGVKLLKHVVTASAILLMWGACWGDAPPPGDTGSIVVAFRCDDYGYPNAGSLEQQIIQVFRERNLRCTFAVIPYFGGKPLSAERGEILRKAVEEGVVDVAQHGYAHDDLRMEGRFGTEFNGIAPAEQERRIEEGKAFLEQVIGRKVLLFIPPHNSYDENTLRILERHGFTYFSATCEGPAPAGTQLRMLPCIANLYEMRAGVEYARTYARGRTSVMVVLMHPDDFVEYNNTAGMHLSLEDLRSSLDWVKAQKDIRAVSLNQAFEVVNDLTQERRLKNRSVVFLTRRTPPFLRPHFPCYLYLDVDQAEALTGPWANTLLALYAAIAVVFFLATFGVGMMLFRRREGTAGILCVCASALLVVVILWGVSDGFTWWRELVAVSVLGGACAGAWLARWRARRRRKAGPVAATN